MSAPNLENYIVCPECKGALIFSPEKCFCKICNISYPILEGIPVMVDLNDLSDHLRDQIKYFIKEEITKEPTYSISPWQESYVKRFTETFDLENGSVVLDCGTGSGYMAIELAKKGAVVLATDLTFSSLQRLKTIRNSLGLTSNIHLFCSNAEVLPIKDGVVDYFISHAVLEHLPREKEAILEINRVTHLNSCLSLVVPLKYRLLNPLLIPLNYIHDRRVGHLRRYTKEDFISKFCHWNLEKVAYTGHFAKVLKTIVNMFFKVFDEEKIEKMDKALEDKKYGASNIVGFFRQVSQ